ncbi:MAG: methyl-accepting chemotaxis protein [Oscillospiraceae bacterium]|nr:methyl-accepting chemotaxis protein [Oscillospiraceae bacterium]
MKLKWKISLPVLILLVLSTLATTVLSYSMTKNSIDQIVDTIVESNLDTLVNLVNHAEATERVVSEGMDNRSLALARAFADVVRLHAQDGTLSLQDVSFFQGIANMLGVDEVHVMDGNGVIVGSNVEVYYGFDFHSGDQTIPFLRILDDPTYELAQEPQANASNGNLFQYAGVARSDAKGFVQIGIGAEMIQNLRDHLDVANMAVDMRIGATGHASIIEDGIVVYSHHADLIGRNVNDTDWYRQISSGNGMTWMDFDGETDYAGYANVGGTTILALFPSAEYNGYLDAVAIAAVIGAVFALLIPVIIYILVTHLLKPLIPLTGYMKKSSSTGDLILSPEDTENIRKLAENKDELGQLIGACAAFVGRITDVSGTLGSVADGDLTVELAALSDRDTLGLSLNKMSGKLNAMFGEIQAAAGQVSQGAKQIADSSQSLAQGSTQQAASIEDLSNSIAEVAQKTKDNAESASETARLADTIKSNAEKGSSQMDEMISAVKEINQSSQNISKVIKVIDDIAFQTNILALNAAVEAARAGQHGKGFAVVAEEVRNLASKSAEAARDTGAMIQDSMEKAEFGVRIAEGTAASLSEIVSGINASSRSITEIARSSEEQSVGIVHINTGIEQVAQVVQMNSATAEESAAASEEMSSQSNMLLGLISEFKLSGGRGGSGYGSGSGSGNGMPGTNRRLSSLSQPARMAPPENTGFTPQKSAEGFGAS